MLQYFIVNLMYFYLFNFSIFLGFVEINKFRRFPDSVHHQKNYFGLRLTIVFTSFKKIWRLWERNLINSVKNNTVNFSEFNSHLLSDSLYTHMALIVLIFKAPDWLKKRYKFCINCLILTESASFLWQDQLWHLNYTFILKSHILKT